MTDLLSELEVVVGLADRVNWQPSNDQFHDLLHTTATWEAMNFLRTHHAEIAAAVRKAKRYDWLREGEHCECGLHVVTGYSDGCELYVGTDLDDEIDSEITAMRAGEGEG